MQNRLEECEAVILEYVVRDLLQGDGRDFTLSTPLLEWGILDSLKLMTLISFVEERFSVKVKDEDVSPDNLGTLKALSALVHSLRMSTS